MRKKAVSTTISRRLVGEPIVKKAAGKVKGKVPGKVPVKVPVKVKVTAPYTTLRRIENARPCPIQYFCFLRDFGGSPTHTRYKAEFTEWLGRKKHKVTITPTTPILMSDIKKKRPRDEDSYDAVRRVNWLLNHYCVLGRLKDIKEIWNENYYW